MTIPYVRNSAYILDIETDPQEPEMPTIKLRPMTFACVAALTLMDIPPNQTEANWPGYEYGDQAIWDGLRTKLREASFIENRQSDVSLTLTKKQIKCWDAVFQATAGDSDCPMSDDALDEFFTAIGLRG